MTAVMKVRQSGGHPTSRRAVLALTAAATVASPLVSLRALAGADAGLIESAATLRAREADIRLSDASPAARTDAEMFAESDAWYRALEAVTRASATSSRGLREKAEALVIALKREVPPFLTDTVEDVGAAHDLLALSLARDVLRVLA